MLKRAATHKGHCQACGRIQCVTGGLMAKHGYTVDYGFFNGVCGGSDSLPMENDLTITQATINALRKYAATQRERATEIEAHPETFQYTRHVRVGWGQKDRVEPCTFEELEIPKQYNADQQRAGAAYRANNNAKHADLAANDLETLSVTINGQPLIVR